MKLLFFATLFMAFFISACSIKADNQRSISLPSWYLSKPANTDVELYGVGSGYTLKESIANALNDISSTIAVSVKSTVNKKTTVDDDIYNKKITEDIKLKTKEIIITNYKVVKSSQIGDNIYTLVSVDKQATYNMYKKKLAVLDSKIDDLATNLPKFKILEKIERLKKIMPLISEAKNYAVILTSLDPEFEYEDYFGKYRSYSTNLHNLKSKLSINVKSENNSDEFSKYFISFLNANGYRVDRNSNSVLISIDSQNSTSQVNGWHICRATTTILVIEDGRIVSSKIVKTLGRSSIDEKTAYLKAAKQFNDKINSIGIEELLFTN